MIKKIIVSSLILLSTACFHSPVYFVESDTEQAIYGYEENLKNHNLYNATSGNHGDVLIISEGDLLDCKVRVTDDNDSIIPNYADPEDKNNFFLGRATSININIECIEKTNIKLKIKWFNYNNNSKQGKI